MPHAREALPLVIFMVSLPLSQRSLDTNLPAETRQAPADQQIVTQIVVEMDANRALSINHQDVTMAALEGRLREIFAERRDKTLYVMGAGSLRYGDVIPVIDAAKGAGVLRVGIITEGMRRKGGSNAS